MKDNTISPEISFELGTGDLSINDIMNQNSSYSSDDRTNDDTDDNDFSYNGEVTSYNFDKIDNFTIESQEDLKQQIEREVNDYSADNGGDNNVDKDNKDYSSDIYNAALQIIRDQQILNIPDDIGELNEETLNQLIQQDQEYRNQQALDFVKSQATDPRLAELVDHVLNGGGYEDAYVFKELIDEQYDYADIDISQEDNQRMLIDMYIREGLNPNSPVDQRRLARLDEEIDSYITNLEGEELAIEAKNYFLDRIEYMKEAEREKVYQRNLELQHLQQQKLIQEKQWIDSFKKSLNEKPWSADKKKQIVSQFDIVQLDNGEELELWKYKWNKIWERPELTQVFMDFISELNPNTLEFTNRNVPVQKQVTNKILEIVNNKKTVSNKFKSDGRNYQQTTSTEPKRAINPSSDW